MEKQAFTAGVKPGGLNNSTDIRILLCYLIKSAAPLARDTLEEALLHEQLVNYFELAGALGDLQQSGLVTLGENGYNVTERGSTIADTLASELPRSVRESATRAVICMQTWARKAAQNQAQVVRDEQGNHLVECKIADMGSDVFTMKLVMPDRLTAEMVQNRFIEKGGQIYALLMDALIEDDIVSAKD